MPSLMLVISQMKKLEFLPGCVFADSVARVLLNVVVTSLSGFNGVTVWNLMMPYTLPVARWKVLSDWPLPFLQEEASPLCLSILKRLMMTIFHPGICSNIQPIFRMPFTIQTDSTCYLNQDAGENSLIGNLASKKRIRIMGVSVLLKINKYDIPD